MVRAGIDERVVLVEHPAGNRHRLHADEPADPLPQGLHERLALTQSVNDFAIGAVFGFVFGLTSVGAGAFFGMALVTLFPLSARRVVGTDLFHGALVATLP